jgi:endonuclease G, mitochondrial
MRLPMLRRPTVSHWRVVSTNVLEAIVQRVGRPAADPERHRPGGAARGLPAGTDALIMGVEPYIKSVGRVEFLNPMAWGGTGWVVAEDGLTRLVATNGHVAKLVAGRTAIGGGTFLRLLLSGVRYGMNLDFKEEVGSLAANGRPFEVRDIVYRR